jgi:hypothetical protein
MRRRALLAAGGAALGSALAGCLDSSSGENGGGGTTTDGGFTTTYAGTDDDLAGTTTDAPGDVSLSVDFERVQPGVLVMGIDSIGVRSDGSQYLSVRVDVTGGEAPARSEFGFRYGGDVFSPLLDLGSGASLYRATEADDDPRYSTPRESGWLLFELPRERSATHAALVYGDREWPAPDAVRQRLSSPAPPLSLDWDAPAEQPAGESTLGFEVTNEGDVDSWFVGGLNGVGIRAAYVPIAGLRREVPAGETVSWEVTHDNGKAADDPGVGDGEPDGEYVLFWTGGERRQAVSFVAPGDA